MRPPPPGDLFAREVVDAIQALETPRKPGRAYACAEADLPPAADYPHCIAILSDTRALVISTYDGASAWEWTNADGSAL